MALTAYLAVKGENQGDIKGDCPQDGDKKDKILVYDIKHNVEIPTDTHNGLPTGQRQHKPLVLTKAVDNASPLLYKACCKGERCEVVLDMYRIKGDGNEEKYFTVKLKDAVVVKMERSTPMTFLPENKPYRDMEMVSFTYSSITWTYNDGNIEFNDDWKK